MVEVMPGQAADSILQRCKKQAISTPCPGTGWGLAGDPQNPGPGDQGILWLQNPVEGFAQAATGCSWNCHCRQTKEGAKGFLALYLEGQVGATSGSTFWDDAHNNLPYHSCQEPQPHTSCFSGCGFLGVICSGFLFGVLLGQLLSVC